MTSSVDIGNTTPSGRHRRRFGRYLAVAFALILLLSASLEAVSAATDLRRYPPPGKLVDLGGYSLHLDCTGQGSPTVVLEGGLGGGVVTWPFVQPLVATSARVCSYDRAGWAWSSGVVAASGHDAVTRLHALLTRAGEKGPYILVGHSMGGLYNQLYAAAYPDEVAGMVLVEARHADFARRSGQGGDSAGLLMDRVVAPVATRLGVARLLGRLGALPGLSRQLPPGMMEIAIRLSSQAALHTEQGMLPLLEEEVRSTALALGNKPVVVVTRDQALATGKDMEIWFETQRLYLMLSGNTRLLEAKGSGHMVPHDNPEAVAAAINEVLKATRP